MSYFSMPFRNDELGRAIQFTLLHKVETDFSSRLDLKKSNEKTRICTEEALEHTKLPAGEFTGMQKFKEKVSNRMTSLAATWQSPEAVWTQQKISFFLSVNVLTLSAYMFGIAPEWVHIAYTIGALTLIPLRWYTYKRKALHYFLFDLCYYTNTLCLIYIWFLPSSTTLFIASYCLTHGSLANAVILWGDSLVFHDARQVTSVFVHLYPTLTLTTIRHFYPNSYTRFPALAKLPHLNSLQALLISGIACIVWQLLYWKFVFVDRREKVESGSRTTLFSWLLNNKRGVVGKYLTFFKPSQREPAFLAGHSMYVVVTELPAIYILYDSPFWSGVFLWIIFAVCVWYGGGFYVEVFGRKFERELKALQKEPTNASISPPSTSVSTVSTPIDSHSTIFDSDSEETSSTHTEEDHDKDAGGISHESK